MLVTLKNDFHRTTAKVRTGKLSNATIKRVQKKLCGIKGCLCSGNLGIRGEQECIVNEDMWGNITVLPKKEVIKKC